MMERFGFDREYDDGQIVEFLFWETEGRFFEKLRVNGKELKAVRISEKAYINAYDAYRDY